METHPDALRQQTHDGAKSDEHEQPRSTGVVAGQSRHDDAERSPLVRVTCLGMFAAYRHRERIQHWENRKARELLAYLATHARCTATHAELVEALWPDDDFVSGQRLLYTAAWALRKTLDEVPAGDGAPPVARASRYVRSIAACSPSAFRSSVLVSDRGRYALDRAICTIDLANLREQLDLVSPDATLAERLALALHASRPLLAGETYPWLVGVRNQLRGRCLTALRQVTHLALLHDEVSTALTALHKRLELDPAHEESVALAMRLHMRQGEFAAAADCYRSLYLALKRRVKQGGDGSGVPSAEVQSLFAATHVRDSRPGPSRAARSPPITPIDRPPDRPQSSPPVPSGGLLWLAWPHLDPTPSRHAHLTIVGTTDSNYRSLSARSLTVGRNDV